MARYFYLSCLLSVMFLALCYGQTESRKFTFKDTRKLVNEWKCSKPKPRIVYLGTFISSFIRFADFFIMKVVYFLEDELEDFDSNTIYIPNAAVVDRCDRTVGCCKQPGHMCTEMKGEDIIFTFQVVDGRKSQKIEVPIRNHLKCRCVLASEKKV